MASENKIQVYFVSFFNLRCYPNATNLDLISKVTIDQHFFVFKINFIKFS